MVPLIHTYIVLKNKLRGGKIWEFISRGPKKKKKRRQNGHVAWLQQWSGSKSLEKGSNS